jgi:hypothetical protein
MLASVRAPWYVAAGWASVAPTFKTRLLERGARNRERVDLVRLAARPTTTALRRRQARRHPHQLLAGAKQRPLERSGDVATVLERPQPLAPERARPRDNAVVDRARVRSQRAPKLVNGDSRQRVLVYVQPDHDHGHRPLPLGATGERTDLNRGKLPSSYQVTLDGLREGDGDTTLGKSAHRRHAGIESAAAFPRLSPQPDNTRRE